MNFKNPSSKKKVFLLVAFELFFHSIQMKKCSQETKQ